MPTDRYSTLAAICSLPEADQKLLFLSGTPMKKQISTFFGQLHLLRPSCFPTFESFALRYCDGEQAQFENRDRRDELRGYLQSLVMVRRLKSEVMADSLPPIRRQVVQVAVGKRERKVLANLRQKYEEAMHAEPPRPQSIKRWRYNLWQASGLAKAGVKADALVSAFGGGDGKKRKQPAEGSAGGGGGSAGGEEEEEEGEAAAVDQAEQTMEAWLKDLISNSQSKDTHGERPRGKILLFAHHVQMMNECQRMLEDIKDSLRKDAGADHDFGFIRVDGSNDASDRTSLLSKFEQDDDVRVALLSITAFSQGVTLNAASTIVFLELCTHASDGGSSASSSCPCHVILTHATF